MNYAELIRAAMNKMDKLVKGAQAENRDLNEDELAVFDSLELEVENLKKGQEREERVSKLRNSLNTPATTSQHIHVGNNRESQKPWESFGHFLLGVKNAYDPSKQFVDARLMSADSQFQNSTGMQVSVGADGGFMVQRTFVQSMMESIAQKSTTFNRINMIPIGEGSNGVTLPALAETSRVNGSRFGGVRAYWANEGGTVAATKPKIREITLKLEKLLAYAHMTEELMRDAGAMESFVRRAYSEEMAFNIDDSIFNGNGLGKPLGILNSPGLITVAKRPNQVADTVVWENIIDMWARLSPSAQTRCAFFINQAVQPELMTMAQNVGTGGVPVYLPAGGASGSPYMTLMGRPVIPVEQLSALGDVGDILLADMSDYIGIDKGQLETDTSIHVLFMYDENTFRFRYRFNGTPYTNSPLTPYKGSATISPYVTLAAR